MALYTCRRPVAGQVIGWGRVVIIGMNNHPDFDIQILVTKLVF